MSGMGRAKDLEPKGKPSSINARQLREANECLVLATLQAQTMAKASEQTTARARKANEHPVVAMVHAQMMTELAAQVTVQLADRSRLESQIVETQKLETLGVLAGGVAHDFNNLMTTILGYTDRGRLAVEPGSNLSHCFEAIDKATSKARELTRQLMAYAGHGERRVEEVDLGVVAKEVSHLLGVSLPSTVTLRCELADRVPFVQGDPTQIFQMAMNLFTNAAEALPAGSAGRITLRSGVQQIDPAALGSGGWILPLAPGRFVTLEVTDNGVGMSPEILARVLEPFYTTKATGHGLGLAAVTGILRGHGGGLRVVSEPGRGSSFTLFLPAMAGARSLPAMEARPVWQAEGRLLIVEAEPEIRSLARGLAEQLGLPVLEAGNGPEAVAIFRRSHGEIALVIMALDLPGMGGEETFRAMQAIDSNVPVVLNSGYQAADAARPIEGLAGRLKTPFRAAEFQALLRRVLGPGFSAVPGLA